VTTANHQALTIRQALRSETEALSQLRLEALQNKPEAFASDVASHRNNALADWEAWFDQRSHGSTGTLFVACTGSQLVGMVGIVRGHSAKTQHGAMVWGVYVRPGYRRQGIAGQLIEACTQWARERGVDIVKLGVTDTNVAAIRLYTACGFQVYGIDPKAIRTDNRDYSELLMAKELNRD
jgi:ribosomal protein S18 acetylase RimI-like enzyme